MPSAAPRWIFGPFALDLANACLWRGTEAVALPSKAFDVLHYLVTHPDRLVTKDELLDAVWPETAVSDAVVRVAIGVLRKVLDDTRQPPRFIATVPRRGYRFLVPVTLAPSAAPTAASPALPVALPLAPPPLLVEREAVLHQLHTRLAQAQQGTRQVVFVTGEPGMGKTAVVETFAAQAVAQAPLWVTHGQCVEHYSTGEAYLPVLEALGHLCRAPESEGLVALLRQQAPTWLVQMPWLLSATDRERLQHELHGATRERMLREFAEVVDALTAETLLLLILEDLHWSDYATLDLLALLARRRTPARLFVLGTYRPGEVIVQGHPLRTVTQELQRQGYGTELAHPHSLVIALNWAVWVYQFRREEQRAQERAEAMIALSAEQGFTLRLASGMILRGWALVAQGHQEEGIAQIRHGMAAWWATGSAASASNLGLLAEAYGRIGQIEEGLNVLAEALAVVSRTGERYCEADLYRLQGEFLLRRAAQDVSRTAPPATESLAEAEQGGATDVQPLRIEAETCLCHALDIARQQQAKSLELRAAMSLARLWQQQGKRAEARELLAPVYSWFTEGFDTADLQEAKALLDQ